MSEKCQKYLRRTVVKDSDGGLGLRSLSFNFGQDCVRNAPKKIRRTVVVVEDSYSGLGLRSLISALVKIWSRLSEKCQKCSRRTVVVVEDSD